MAINPVRDFYSQGFKVPSLYKIGALTTYTPPPLMLDGDLPPSIASEAAKQHSMNVSTASLETLPRAHADALDLQRQPDP